VSIVKTIQHMHAASYQQLYRKATSVYLGREQMLELIQETREDPRLSSVFRDALKGAADEVIGVFLKKVPVIYTPVGPLTIRFWDTPSMLMLGRKVSAISR
jgi:hypothetical protein